MKALLLIIFLFVSGHIFSQNKIVIHTDSSRIETDTFRKERIVYEYMKNRDLVKWTYYNEKNIIETKAQYDTTEHPIGVWYEYDENGELIRTEDYDNRTWTVYQKQLYPYKTYLDQIKFKADKIVIDAYGVDFFSKHTKWDFGQCAIYFKGGGGGDWTEPISEKPISFLIRYDIVTDNGKLYDDLIEFQLNSKGELYFPFELPDDVKGFEKISSKSSFKLTEFEAIQKAKNLGLTETDTTKAEAFLFWDYFKDKKLTQFNGQFKFYVIIKSNSIRDIRPQGRSEVIDKYDVYVFSPWTGDFLEKKKMKTVRGWEKNSGSSTGLLPDE
jgi:YD repeat-containing protein